VSDVFSAALGASRFLNDAACSAAHELGIFDALPAPAADLGVRLRLPQRRLSALVRALVADGALLEEDGQLRRGTVPHRRAFPRAGWGRLADVIRADRPLSAAAVDGMAGEELQRFHDHLRRAGMDAAREVAERLGPDGPLLDLGGGTGIYAAAFLERYPGQRAMVVDRPEVLELARVTPSGADLVPLDLLGPDPWPRGARIALLANVLHLFPAADAARIVDRAAHAVAPGGVVLVKDFDADSPAGVLFSLNMALFTEAGEVHGIEALRSFFSSAGLRDVSLERLRCAPESILLLGTAP
jgi:O-methyltransferase domain